MSIVSITSDEVNYLVFRYLQESGFVHSAFSFAHESLITKSNIDGSHVPSGALITFLQKGLQCVEIETHLAPDGSEILCDAPFSLTQPHQCHLTQERKEDSGPEEEVVPNGSHPMDVSDESDAELVIPEDHVSLLSGHSNEVYVCAWNPVHHTLASGSGDNTARIWATPPSEHAPIVLRHHDGTEDAGASKGVTTLDWSADGTYLATGSYDGQAHIWTESGVMKCALKEHKGPVFALKWNKRSDLLLSASADKTAIVWDANTGDVAQKFALHKAPTLDVDWRNNDSFASCSTDKMIFVCKVGQPQPIKVFEGHNNEVNAVRWDPQGEYLASCSDDFTVKVWHMRQDTHIYSFEGHSQDIFTIRWSNTGPGTANPTDRLYLASASLDATIRLWEVETGTCVYTLTRCNDPVYSVAFSPNGLYLASGSYGGGNSDRGNNNVERGEVKIWSIKDGKLIKTYRGLGGIFEVCWSPQGEKVAACFSNSTLAVIDFVP
eukprot:c8174_g1_i1.p1 GENE.c8174_g1_i1~~c8174_g1_i1.p1  ORF type:complete len:492 (-),score=52.37 c8174_g1_i1:161-1636(-)